VPGSRHVTNFGGIFIASVEMGSLAQASEANRGGPSSAIAFQGQEPRGPGRASGHEELEHGLILLAHFLGAKAFYCSGPFEA
jgi:hypothetical protein